MHRQRAFIIPNPWDAGTARLLAHLGFEALATTSMGFAFSTGRPDNTVGRDDSMAHIVDLSRATDLPVSADLENGFNDSPEGVAETIALAATAGADRRSIEDATGRADDPIYSKGKRRTEFARRRGSPRPALYLHVDRTRRELPAWTVRPCRYHRTTAGLPGSGRGRSLRAGTHRQRGHRRSE